MKGNTRKAMAIVTAFAIMINLLPMFSVGVKGAYADSFTIKAAAANGTVGATMPYVRYDSAMATIGGGAVLATSNNMDRYNVASQASEHSYVRLPDNGSYAQWTAKSTGAGITMRFTMPDSSDGYGISGSLDVYVNGTFKQRVDLTSYYMWQYFAGGNPSDANDGGPGAFAFDEVHFKLNEALKVGDIIKIQSTKASSVEYGVDFLEIENVPAEIARPANSLSVTDYGAVPNDGGDDYQAIRNCINDANAQKKTVYIPAGTFNINEIWQLNASDIKITGAGMWYTNIKFTNSNKSSGGISCNAYNVEFCNMYINSSLRSRYNQEAVYKCFMDILGNGSVVHDVWEDHFECGFWMADYSGQGRYSDGLKIVDCRIRNNLADGVNFCQGTSNSAVYNCSIRNNGDDGLAMWNNDFNGVKDESGNVFAYNTIDLIWRAGAIAIYGGNNHKVYNNYICDSFMSSGIHLNTTFPGYKFNNTASIAIDNNVLVRAGSGKGSWGEEFGAIDITGDVHNISFSNNKIYDAVHDAISLNGSGVNGITFNNTVIYGAGCDGQQYNYGASPHNGAAVIAINGASATVNTMSIANIAHSGTNYISGSNVGLNNVTTASSNYEVPAYPGTASGNINPGTTNPAETTKTETTAPAETTVNTNKSDIVLNGNGSETDSFIKTFSYSGDYKYNGFVSFKNATNDYKFLKLTYTGEISSLRLELVRNYGQANEVTGGVYWFDQSNPGNKFIAADGTSIELNGNNKTVIIDLIKTNINIGDWQGAHIHTGNGTTNSFTVSDARLMTSYKSNASTNEVRAEINGFQVSSIAEGARTVYSVGGDSTKISQVGLVYGLKQYVSENEMVVGSTNTYVLANNGTENGKLSNNYSNTMSSATSYAMTMTFGNVSPKFFEADILVRAYVKTTDGKIVYSDVKTMNIYNVADELYKTSKMPSKAGHEYLYDKILKSVNNGYGKIEYDYRNTIMGA